MSAKAELWKSDKWGKVWIWIENHRVTANYSLAVANNFPSTMERVGVAYGKTSRM